MSRLSQTIKQVIVNNKRNVVVPTTSYVAFNNLLKKAGIYTCIRIGMYGNSRQELRYSLFKLILGGAVCLGSTL